MRAATYYKALLWLLVLIAQLASAQAEKQASHKRPLIGVALATREGAPSAAAIGSLRALGELGVPIDFIVTSQASALVGALYATRHSYREMSESILELKNIYTDANASSPSYASDFRVRRFLTSQLSEFDLASHNDLSRLPTPFSTIALDLVTGRRFVFTKGSLTDAVRASLGSFLFMEPLGESDHLFVGANAPDTNVLRSMGADIVIVVFDSGGLSDPRRNEWDLSKFSVSELYQRAATGSDVFEQLQRADVTVPIHTREYTATSTGSLERIIEAGYQETMQRSSLLKAFALSPQEFAARESALDTSYRKLLSDIAHESLSTVGVRGNRYLTTQWILDTLDIKPGKELNRDAVVKGLDRIYASGFVRTCWATFEREQESGIRVVVHVKESDVLPLDALPELTLSLQAPDAGERRFAARAIANLGPKAKDALPQLVQGLTDDDRSVRSAFVRAMGTMGREARASLGQVLTLLTTERDESVRNDLAWAFARIAVSLHTEDDLGAIKTLEDSLSGLEHNAELADFADSIRLSLDSLKRLRAARLSNTSDSYAITERELPSWMTPGTELSLNGRAVKVDLSSDRKEVQFLGGEVKSVLRQGLNRIVSKGQEFVFWNEERKLLAYKSPYTSSFAIVVAIDDYGRQKDPLHRPPTGLDPLTAMVSNANALVDALQKVGFPKSNIITLYNEQASKEAVNAALESFWQGGARSGADRLLFYFGGHGDKSPNNVPYLATYDFDKSKPTLTSVLMRDLTERYSQNISAKHVLFILDACDSGLTLRTLGDSDTTGQEVRRFQALSVIRRDTDAIARNIFVAGTGDQAALYQNGGIFTKALVAGLNGEADLNQDGIIQFEELGVYVRDKVTAQAAQAAVRQDPDFRILDQYGSGRVVFVK